MCGPGFTAPIPVVWAGGSSAPAAAPAAAAQAAAAAGHAGALSPAATAAPQAPAAVWPCRVAVQLPAMLAADDRASGGNGDTCTTSGISDHDPTVSLAEPCQRRWLVVRNGDGTPQQLAYRLLRGNGRHHLVLYADEQPPLRVVSTASVHLEVGLTTPQHQGCDCCIAGVCPHTSAMICVPHITRIKTDSSDLVGHRMGRFAYGEGVSQAFHLAPGQQVDCEVAAPAAVHQQEHAQQQQHSAAGADLQCGGQLPAGPVSPCIEMGIRFGT